MKEPSTTCFTSVSTTPSISLAGKRSPDHRSDEASTGCTRQRGTCRTLLIRFDLLPHVCRRHEHSREDAENAGTVEGVVHGSPPFVQRAQRHEKLGPQRCKDPVEVWIGTLFGSGACPFVNGLRLEGGAWHYPPGLTCSLSRPSFPHDRQEPDKFVHPAHLWDGGRRRVCGGTRQKR